MKYDLTKHWTTDASSFVPFVVGLAIALTLSLICPAAAETPVINYPSADVKNKYERIDGDSALVYWAESNKATVIWDIARKNTFLGSEGLTQAEAFLTTYIADPASTEKTFAIITLGVLRSERATEPNKLLEVDDKLRPLQLAAWQQYWRTYISTRVALNAGDSARAIANLSWLIDHASDVTDTSDYRCVAILSGLRRHANDWKALLQETRAALQQ